MTVDRGAPPRVRLEDVALAARVSKSTASRILTNHRGLTVRPETRERVLAAAERMQYRPHIAAQMVSGARSRALALLIPDLTNPVFARITRGAYRRAVQEGYVVLIAEDATNQQGEDTFTELVHTGRVDGLLVASARPGSPLLRHLRQRPVPHVFVNRAVPGSGRNVTVDSAAASALAVRYLVELGHTAIGHVAGPSGIDTARAREAGFRDAARAAELRIAPVARGAFAEEAGAEAAVRLLTRHRVSALYVSSLTQAIGVLGAARSMAITVPDELSVITFDNMPMAAFLNPPLTAIEMPMQELGSEGVAALVAQLDGAAPGDVVVPAAPMVVPRHSTSGPSSPRVHSRRRMRVAQQR